MDKITSAGKNTVCKYAIQYARAKFSDDFTHFPPLSLVPKVPKVPKATYESVRSATLGVAPLTSPKVSLYYRTYGTELLQVACNNRYFEMGQFGAQKAI